MHVYLAHASCVARRYECTAQLATRKVKVTTPVAEGDGTVLSERVALVPILRAGLGMVDAMQELLPTSHCHHIGMYRDSTSLVPILYYNRLPAEVDCDVAIVLEPMIATAGTINASLRILKDWGATNIKVLSIVAAREGLTKLNEAHPDVEVFVGHIDESLNEHGYIVPGLGDVGDRMFGTPHDKPDLDHVDAATPMRATPKRLESDGATPPSKRKR